MNDDQLGAGYRAGGMRDQLPGCPESDELLELVDRELPEARRLELLDHVMACRACREDYELLRTTAEAARGAVAGATGHRADWQRWALAATVVVALGGAAFWALGGRSRFVDDVPRGDPGDAFLIEPVAAPGGSIPAPDRFVWHRVPDAIGYRVEILGADGQALFVAESADTAVARPGELTLPAGVELTWWVMARLRGGGERRSALQRFTVR